MTPRNAEDKAISLGHPSYVWRFGQQRRLTLIQRYAPLQGKRVLDVGCGIGMYLQAMRAYTERVYGVDIDLERAVQAHQSLPHIVVAPAERLPFAQHSFEVVLLHEVIEHVEDDYQTIREAYRVLTCGGRMVILAPNRLYPLETHGIFWRGRYHFGNIPLVNWLPDPLRNRLAPHVRTYTRQDLRGLLAGLQVKVLVHTQIFAGYDKIAARWPIVGRGLRRLTYSLERSPIRILGLSHFLVAKKKAAGQGS